MSATIKNILYPTDFSELSLHAIPYVQLMAGAFDAAVHCVHVVDDGFQTWAPIGPESIPITVPVEELTGIAKAQMEKFVAQHLAGLKSPPATSVVVGRPFLEIINAARECQADVIIMSTHGRGALAHVLLGSTTEKVVQKAPCAVMTIRGPAQ